MQVPEIVCYFNTAGLCRTRMDKGHTEASEIVKLYLEGIDKAIVDDVLRYHEKIVSYYVDENCFQNIIERNKNILNDYIPNKKRYIFGELVCLEKNV